MNHILRYSYSRHLTQRWNRGNNGRDNMLGLSAHTWSTRRERLGTDRAPPGR